MTTIDKILYKCNNTSLSDRYTYVIRTVMTYLQY